MIRCTYKYRLYPTHEQVEQLTWTLDRCRELYNAALQERRDAYRMAGKSLSYYDQQAELPAVKVARPEYWQIANCVLQDVVRRLDRAFQAFFRRVKTGEKPGYPRFQGRDHYDSFTYPQYHNGTHLNYSEGKWGTLTLCKFGTIKTRITRPVAGTIKTVTIHRDGDQWYACLSCEVEPSLLPASDEATGIDLGLLHFATLADGSTIANPRYLRHSLKRLKRAQQTLSGRKRGSHRRGKVRKVVAQLHRRVRNQRADFCHKQARQLVNRYGLIVLEDLAPTNMVQNHHLALSISDAGWGLFTQLCIVKAASAGRTVVLINPAYTSQTCSRCGLIRKKTLAERWHSCECGCELDRDHNAALNILRLGRSQQAVSACQSLSPHGLRHFKGQTR